MNISKLVREPTKQANISRVAMHPENEIITKEGSKPTGLFDAKINIITNDIELSNDILDIEFNIPFDCNLEPNEAEIIIYNLSSQTIKGLIYNKIITVKAGYGGDTGIIYVGRISKVTSGFLGEDKVTTIYAFDDQDFKDKSINEISYKKGTKSSYILRDLIARFKLPIAAMKTRYDHVNKSGVKIDGSLIEAIDNYAKQCGVDVFIQKGKIYAIDVRTASKSIDFKLSVDTGLIGSPEYFEEEICEEDRKETIKGYKADMLLQHRMEAGVKVEVSSRDCNGVFSVRAGEHIYNGSDFKTTVELIV